VKVRVGVREGVDVRLPEAVFEGVGVSDGLRVGDGVDVVEEVGVREGVEVRVGVRVRVGVEVGVRVAVDVELAVGVGDFIVEMRVLANTIYSPGTSADGRASRAR